MLRIMDYKGNSTDIDIDLHNIQYMAVAIISGDEVVAIKMTDNQIYCYDSSNERGIDYQDNLYLVDNTDIDFWNSIKANNAYDRMKVFEAWKEKGW